MFSSIVFSDFTSELNYLKLQNSFAIYDERENPYQPPFKKVSKTDFNIIFKDVNPLTDEDSYLDKSFYDDFLIPNIKTLGKRYISSIKKRIEAPEFLEIERKQLFAIQQQHKLNSLDNELNNANYIENKIRKLIRLQIEIATEYLVNIHIHPNREFDDMLKFKLNRDTVLLLFAMLYERKYIDAPSFTILGRILDSNFLYWDNKNGQFKPFRNSGKVMNDFKNDNKPAYKSLNKLKEIFSADFFDFPYE